MQCNQGNRINSEDGGNVEGAWRSFCGSPMLISTNGCPIPAYTFSSSHAERRYPGQLSSSLGPTALGLAARKRSAQRVPRIEAGKKCAAVLP